MKEFLHNYYFVDKIKPVFTIETNYPFSDEFVMKQMHARKCTQKQINEEMIRLFQISQEKEKVSRPT